MWGLRQKLIIRYRKFSELPTWSSRTFDTLCTIESKAISQLFLNFATTQFSPVLNTLRSTLHIHFNLPIPSVDIPRSPKFQSPGLSIGTLMHISSISSITFMMIHQLAPVLMTDLYSLSCWKCFAPKGLLLILPHCYTSYFQVWVTLTDKLQLGLLLKSIAYHGSSQSQQLALGQ